MMVETHAQLSWFVIPLTLAITFCVLIIRVWSIQLVVHNALCPIFHITRQYTAESEPSLLKWNVNWFSDCLTYRSYVFECDSLIHITQLWTYNRGCYRQFLRSTVCITQNRRFWGELWRWISLFFIPSDTPVGASFGLFPFRKRQPSWFSIPLSQWCKNVHFSSQHTRCAVGGKRHVHVILSWSPQCIHVFMSNP